MYTDESYLDYSTPANKDSALAGSPGRPSADGKEQKYLIGKFSDEYNNLINAYSYENKNLYLLDFLHQLHMID